MNMEKISAERICYAYEYAEKYDGDIEELHLDEKNYYIADEADREIRKQKRKRCLALAKWCDERIFRVERDYVFWRYGKDYAINFYKKWRDRWLAIADKFKEA